MKSSTKATILFAIAGLIAASGLRRPEVHVRQSIDAAFERVYDASDLGKILLQAERAAS
jgi:hypothetical protein